MHCVRDERYHSQIFSVKFADIADRLLNEFKEYLGIWKTWDNITVIQNHQQIKDYLRNLFQIMQVCNFQWYYNFYRSSASDAHSSLFLICIAKNSSRNYWSTMLLGLPHTWREQSQTITNIRNWLFVPTKKLRVSWISSMRYVLNDLFLGRSWH